MDRSSHLYLLITSLFLLQWLIDFSSANPDINTDRSSLIAVKSRISFDPHSILTKNWSSESSICSWIGVTCDPLHQRVTQLNISSMGLVGTIAPEIGNLSSLVSLNLSENSLGGPIPSSIFNMSLLEVLNLRNNSLSSSLPFDMCKHNQHRLKKLHISYNLLYGEIPSSLDQCSRLDYLSLRSNNFSGYLPAQVGNLTLLRVLYLGVNNLRGNIPKEIGYLSNLLRLSIRVNQFSGSLPKEIWNMTSLTSLLISNNKLSGPIPSTYVNQSGLLDLDLYSNYLTGEIPPSICNLRFLLILDLSKNKLEGTLPDCLGNMSTSLMMLHSDANKLTGPIPSTFTKGCRLEFINLSGNKLEGILPQTLINCQRLGAFDIGDNEIRGAFPFWMETLPQLRILVLRSNRFDGTMLASSNTKQPFPKLQVLDVSHNGFFGSLPDRYFKNFRGMIDANVNQTYYGDILFHDMMDLTLTLKGTDHLLDRMLSTFTTIDLSSNKFSGSIPPSLGNLNSLIFLNLSRNNLKGHIPSSLGGMKFLESLDLSSNKLDGEIPSGLARLTFLAKLNLSMNNLEGQIPQSTQLSTFGNESYVGNAGLCGFPLTIKCERSDGKPSQPEVESYREIEWDYVFAAAGYVVGLGIFSWLLIFCPSFRHKYFERLEDVFENIFECCRRRKKRDIQEEL